MPYHDFKYFHALFDGKAEPNDGYLGNSFVLTMESTSAATLPVALSAVNSNIPRNRVSRTPLILARPISSCVLGGGVSTSLAFSVLGTRGHGR